MYNPIDDLKDLAMVPLDYKLEEHELIPLNPEELISKSGLDKRDLKRDVLCCNQFNLSYSSNTVNRFIKGAKNKRFVLEMFNRYLSDSDLLVRSMSLGSFKCVSFITKLMSFLKDTSEVKPLAGSYELKETNQHKTFKDKFYSCEKYPALTKMFLLRSLLSGEYNRVIRRCIKNGDITQYIEMLTSSEHVTSPYSEFEEIAGHLVGYLKADISYLNGDPLLFLDRLISSEDFLDSSNVINILIALKVAGHSDVRLNIHEDSLALLLAYSKVLSDVEVSYDNLFEFNQNWYLNLIDFAYSTIEKAKQELSSYVALFNSVSENYSRFNLYSCKVREEYYTDIMIKNISRGSVIGPEFSDIFTNELCNLLNILISKYNYGRFDLNIGSFRQVCNIDDFGNREIGTVALMLMFQYLSEYENEVLSINEDYAEIFKFILNCVDSESFYKIYEDITDSLTVYLNYVINSI